MSELNQPNIPVTALAAIVDNAVDAIINIDEMGLIVSANPATEKLFGHQVKDLIGQNVKMLMPNPYQEEHDGYLDNYKSSGVPKIIGIGREVVGKRKDSTTFPMHLAVSEILVGNRRMFTGIVRDISDLKAAEMKLAEMNEHLEYRVKKRTEQLRSAQAELVRSEKFATLGKVSGGIAHEIRNPLNAVKTSAYYLLNAKNVSEEKVREHLKRIDRQVTMIDNVVTALSDVAKLPEAILNPLAMQPVIKRLLNAIELPSNVEVTAELPNDLPMILADENQIEIAFKNLIRNARDAMPEGGELRITAEISTASISFQVSDTGTGISPEDLQQILEPLFTTKARGMGLGLSITRAVVEKNQGKLKVESELGVGSQFSIVLKRWEESSSEVHQ
jgi:two-component system sensor kinase FixL